MFSTSFELMPFVDVLMYLLDLTIQPLHFSFEQMVRVHVTCTVTQFV